MKPKLPPLKEDAIQEQIVQALVAVGCHVYHTNTHGVRGKTGVSRGVADLLVKHPWFPTGMQLCIEVKKPRGWKWSSEEQEAAYFLGHTCLAFCPYDALDHLERVVAAVGGSPEDLLRIRSLRDQFPKEEFTWPRGTNNHGAWRELNRRTMGAEQTNRPKTSAGGRR